MICTSRIIIFLFCIIFYNSVFSQVSGTIYYTNGEMVELNSFDELCLELYYYSSSDRKTIDPGEYGKFLPLERLSQINFIYEKGNTAHDFYYLLTVKGTKKNNSPYKTNIRAWDWLEISSPETGEKSDTRVVFFFKEKKMKIDRILFHPSSSTEL